MATLSELFPEPVAASAPPPGVDEQQAALEVCRTEPFVDLSGTAGVGKTWVARELAQDPSVMLCATTGIASVNLGEGTTINAALKYFDTASMKDAFLKGYLQSQLRKLRRVGVRTLVLDEKSMLNADQLTYLVRALDDVNKGKGYDASLEGYNADEPIRGDPPMMGLVLVGDFGQLPPVPDKDPLTQKSLPVKFAFDSPEWERFAKHRVVLTQIRRQTDRDFIGALHAVRRGDTRSALEFFTQTRFSEQIDDQFGGTTIFAKNDAVDRYNALRMDALRGRALTYTSTRTGKQRGDWKLIPDVLTLKEGALVMVLANHRVYANDEDEIGALLYCNGDLGTLLAPQGLGWRVKLHRTGGEVNVLPITRHNTIPLEPGRRKELIEELGVDGAKARIIDSRQEIVGSVSYMPLRCAYGCTVHKTQGLTLDAVQVNLTDPFFRQPGMLFVALSRARSASGLRIVGSPRGFAERCTVNGRVGRWL